MLLIVGKSFDKNCGTKVAYQDIYRAFYSVWHLFYKNSNRFDFDSQSCRMVAKFLRGQFCRIKVGKRLATRCHKNIFPDVFRCYTTFQLLPLAVYDAYSPFPVTLLGGSIDALKSISIPSISISLDGAQS